MSNPLFTGARISATSRTSAQSRREAALNWLALGLLLAAWNATDDAANKKAVNEPAETARPRPQALRGYSYVSVRAVQRMASGSSAD
jgi:hypothetical protein